LTTERTERRSNAQRLVSVLESGVTKSTHVTVVAILLTLTYLCRLAKQKEYMILTLAVIWRKPMGQ